jgi:hypothetical protein
VADSGLSVKERPIIFSGPLIPHILDGSKTQTRRPVRRMTEQHHMWQEPDGAFCWELPEPVHATSWPTGSVACPYGEPGDRLWVREAFCPDWTDHTIYRADGGSAMAAGYASEPKWRPSIHMPRAVSRIILEVTQVRIERVQSITEDDARAEGVEPGPGHRLYPGTGAARSMSYTSGFVIAWDGIYGKREQGWGVNPWVWVVVFRNIAL